MKFTLRPLTAIIMGSLLTLAGLYLALAGEGTIVIFGWIMAAMAVLSVVANLWLHYHEQGRV